MDKLQRLLFLAEEGGLTRSRFLERVSGWLDGEELAEDERERLFMAARDLAEGSTRLKSDLVERSEAERAGRLLQAEAGRLQADPDIRRLLSGWPAPIAHELDLLLGLMASGVAPDSALLQLRDAYEIVTKLSVVLLAAALGPDVFLPQRLMGGHSFGQWVGLLHEVQELAAQHALPPALAPLGKGKTAAQLYQAVQKFSPVRNDIIGHGARARPEETAALVLTCLNGGDYHTLRGTEERLIGLLPALRPLVAAGAFAGLDLVAGEGAHAQTAHRCRGLGPLGGRRGPSSRPAPRPHAAGSRAAGRWHPPRPCAVAGGAHLHPVQSSRPVRVR